MDQIEELHSFKDCTYYRTSCSCMDSNHNLTFSLEYEEDMNMLNMYFEVMGPAPHCFDWERPFYIKMWNRIKLCCMVLFKGRITYEESFIFRGEKQVRDLIKALEEGLDKLKMKEE